jgi:hypothetical protein
MSIYSGLFKSLNIVVTGGCVQEGVTFSQLL